MYQDANAMLSEVKYKVQDSFFTIKYYYKKTKKKVLKKVLP